MFNKISKILISGLFIQFSAYASENQMIEQSETQVKSNILSLFDLAAPQAALKLCDYGSEKGFEKVSRLSCMIEFVNKGGFDSLKRSTSMLPVFTWEKEHECGKFFGYSEESTGYTGQFSLIAGNMQFSGCSMDQMYFLKYFLAELVMKGSFKDLSSVRSDCFQYCTEECMIYFLTPDLNYKELLKVPFVKYLDKEIISAYATRDFCRTKNYEVRQVILDIINGKKTLSGIEEENSEIALKISNFYPRAVKFIACLEIGKDPIQEMVIPPYNELTHKKIMYNKHLNYIFNYTDQVQNSKLSRFLGI